MIIGPALRRALHECVDLLCDSIAEDARNVLTVKPGRPKKTSRPFTPPPADFKPDPKLVAELGKRTGMY